MAEEQVKAEESRDLETVVKDYGLSTSKARQIVENFQDVFDLADRWEHQAKQIKVSGEDDHPMMAAARSLRLEIRQRRLAVEASRKELKEDALREGRAIDGVANVLKGIMVPLEKYLDEQEHYAEIQQQRREEERRRLADEALREKEEREAEARRKAEEEARQAELAEAEARRKAAEKKAREAEKARKAAEAQAAAERKAREEEDRKRAEAEAKRQAEEEARRKAEAEERRKAQAEADRRHQEELAKAREEAALAAAMVKCPKCGHAFDSREHHQEA